MFGNVLIGVDGTPDGLDAVALATVLAEPGARLTLAHVYAERPTPGRVSNRLFHGFYERARADSIRLLELARTEAGVDAALIAVGAPSVGRGLHTLAEEHGADLLVVGSCGRGPVGRVVIGDDTRASLNGAACAVAIAPRGYAADTTELARIGVGYDFTDESRVALAAAREVAGQHDASVSAITIVAQPIGAYASPMPSDWGYILEQERQDAAERLRSIEDVEATAIYGAPFEELAAFGDRVDLLVVGSRSYGPVRRLVFGSTSSHLTRHAHCPLLVLPRASADPAPGHGPRGSATAPVGAAS